MRRSLFTVVGVLLGLWAATPVVLAAGPATTDARVLVSVNGPIDLPAGQVAEFVMVVNGDATIAGDVRALVVINGDATLSDARASSVTVINGNVALTGGTVVEGDVQTLNGQVEQAAGATVQGSVKRLEADARSLGLVLVPALILLVVGFALVTLIVALGIAALAAKQTRAAELLISRQPGPTLLAAVLGIILIPVVGILVTLTVVGAPIGLTLLLVVLPTVAYVGWIVAAIWLGDWILIRTRGAAEPERPYLAAVVGVVVLGLASLIPPVSAIASLFGFGALLLLAWRVFRHEPLTPASPAGSIGYGSGG